MKKITFLVLFFLIWLGNKFSFGQSLPVPDHTVIVILENHLYSQIVGSGNAPFINSLLTDSNCANFSKSFALTHPSQPNYLFLFSGSDQGVTTNLIPVDTPFSTCNLGASLLAQGYSFKGYSEDLPSIGYKGETSGFYVRKHNPWVNWQTGLVNGIPDTCNQPFSNFPADYSQLPAVSIVVPNLIHDMHDSATTPAALINGDTWLFNNFNNYIQWTKTNNSLFILTFDEDDFTSNNRILTLFLGPMVQGGTYSDSITHYNVLRTLEDMYALPYCGASQGATAINNCWVTSGVTSQQELLNEISIWPLPAKDILNLQITSERAGNAVFILTDLSGRIFQSKELDLHEGENTMVISVQGISSGTYILKINGDQLNLVKKIMIEN